MTAVLEAVRSENATTRELNGLSQDAPLEYTPLAYTREGDGD